MEDRIRRLFVERREDLNVEATNLLNDLKKNLKIDGLKLSE